MSEPLTLVSHRLCPYVQRAAIALSEKDVPFRRIVIDLSDKPAWFREISPLGKVPVLLVDGTALFESAAILEFLEDTQPRPLHPADPIERARHRGWIEFCSSLLADIARFYNAGDAAALAAARDALRAKFERLEQEHSGGPWFAGPAFSLVDASFAPVFRYFDVFEEIADFGILDNLPALADWRRRLAARASVAGAVDPDYRERLMDFLAARQSHLSGLVPAARGASAA